MTDEWQQMSPRSHEPFEKESEEFLVRGPHLLEEVWQIMSGWQQLAAKLAWDGQVRPVSHGSLQQIVGRAQVQNFNVLSDGWRGPTP